MKSGVKIILILLVVLIVFRIAIGVTGIKIPMWITGVGMAIWLPFIAWLVIKLPGWRRQHEQRKNSEIRRSVQADRSVSYVDDREMK